MKLQHSNTTHMMDVDYDTSQDVSLSPAVSQITQPSRCSPLIWAMEKCKIHTKRKNMEHGRHLNYSLFAFSCKQWGICFLWVRAGTETDTSRSGGISLSRISRNKEWWGLCPSLKEMPCFSVENNHFSVKESEKKIFLMIFHSFSCSSTLFCPVIEGENRDPAALKVQQLLAPLSFWG